jgi:CheY-like chemotaxis protein
MRILYVEDNEINQALVERVMRARQHTVLFREDGEGALKLLADDAAIDLILLDIELAGAISGLEVIQTLRARGDTRPVVAVTAYAMTGDRERFLEAGCDQYLPKPLNITDLMAMLDDYDARLSVDQSAASPSTPASEAAPAAAAPPSPPSPPAPAAESTPAPPAQPASPGTSIAAPDKAPGANGRAPARAENTA